MLIFGFCLLVCFILEFYAKNVMDFSDVEKYYPVYLVFNLCDDRIIIKRLCNKSSVNTLHFEFYN